MQLDPARNSAAENYKLLANLIVPRPIAWISTVDKAGVVNLAPFSFFNAVASEPLYLVLGLGSKKSGELKDTARNILDSGEFVVNLVTEELFAAMNVTAADFPSSESELVAAGLHAAPSVAVKPPRVAECQASMECRLHSSQPLGDCMLVIGEVVMFHVADHLVGPRMDIRDFAPVGRMGISAGYCRTRDQFDAPRIIYDQWVKNSK